MTSTRPRPGHVLGAHAPTLRAVDPTDLGLEEALGDPEVEVAPTPGRVVVVRRGRPSARALVATPSPADPHHDPFGRERHALDNDSFNVDHAIKCSSGAHVVLPASLV